MQKLGIILAGGKSSRLFPASAAVVKQLFPVYDKPLIYYPLTTLMLDGIRDFVIITNPNELTQFKTVFKNCEEELGINVTFIIQEYPVGIADAFRLVHRHLQNKVYDYYQHALILGDNIFYGSGFSGQVWSTDVSKANIFLYQTTSPSMFGIAELDSRGRVVTVEEKPTNPKSNLAITGLYFYPPSVYEAAFDLAPSARGEYEITDLNRTYLHSGALNAIKLARGTMWFDTGTPSGLLQASTFVNLVQSNSNVLIGSPHEVAYLEGLITRGTVQKFANTCSNTAYCQYLSKML